MSHKSDSGLWAVVGSVLASLFGVQSHKNYERDFTQGTFITYAVIGVVMVILFVVSLFTFVKWYVGS